MGIELQPKRSNAEKERALHEALQDHSWFSRSARELGRATGTRWSMADRVRREVERRLGIRDSRPAVVRGKDGRTYQARRIIPAGDGKPPTSGSATEAWQIEVGDCVPLMRRQPAGCARLIFADPPYNLGVDYGDGVQADLLSPEKYLAWCLSWMREAGRLLAPDGSLWVLISHHWAAEFNLLLKKEAGLKIRNWIQWYESFGVRCKNNFSRCSRHLFYCVKDLRRYVFNPEAVTRPKGRRVKHDGQQAVAGGKVWDNVWQIPRLAGAAKERIPDFPNQLPLDLLRPIVGCASDPGDLVIDPFAGSATTGAACLELGRRFIGMEKRADFARLARERLSVRSKMTSTE